MAILKRSKKSILGLDIQLGNIETNIAVNGSNLSTEISNRVSGDANIQTQMNTEKSRIDLLVADDSTTGSVDYKVATAVNALATATNVYTKSETDTLLDAKIDGVLALSTISSTNKVVTQTELASKANAVEVYSKSETDTFLNGKADASSTYTKTEVDTSLANKADASTTYTKTEVDSAISPKANSADVYTKSEIDTTMGNVLVDSDTVTAVSAGNKVVTETELSTKANSADVYTQTQLDNALVGKADSSVSGKVGPSLVIVDETNKADAKVLSFNNTTGNLEYVDQTGGATINDTVTNATEGWSSNKISSELSTKADASSVYTKTETDGLVSAASQGIKYTVATVSDLSNITGMSTDDQALVNEDRYVYKYDGSNWSQFYAMDAAHNHDDRYYTETEMDAFLGDKANSADVYTKSEIDTSLSGKADVASTGKVGPSLVTVDETNKADGKILSYNNATGNLEYVDQDGSGIINDSAAAADTTYSSNKINTELSLKANAADVYTKTETDTFNGTVLVDGDTLTTVDGANKIVTETELNTKANSADVYTKTQIDTSLNGKVNTSDVKTAIAGDNKVVTESDIVGKADVSSVYTKAESDTNLANKANVGESYTKAEDDNLLSGKLDTTLTVTSATAGNKIVTETEISGLANASDVYTKTETNNLLTPKFDQTNAVSTVDGTNKIVTETELATKVNVADVKTTISAGNKVVTESDVAAAITASENAAATAPELVVDRPTLSTKSSSGLDYVFEFTLSKTPHGSVCVGDEITIYNFYEDGTATTFENVSIFNDKHGEISATLASTDDESKYSGKTVKITYLSTDTAPTPGSDAQNPIIINAGIDFEDQGDGTTDYNLDYSAGLYYRVVFTDGYYTNINHDTTHTGFHATNSTDYQAFHYKADDTLMSQAWVGQTDEAQYVTYNWTMSFANVSGATYKVSFTRDAAVGGGGL